MFKKIAAVFLSVMLLAAGAGVLTGNQVSAASSMRVIVNGQELQPSAGLPYTNGSNVMLPLRETAEALKYRVTYTGATGTFLLERFQESIQFRLSGQELLLNGKEKVPYTGGFELKQKRAYAPLSFFSAVGLVTSYDAATGQVELYSPEVTASAVAGLLATGNYQALRDRYYAKETEALSQPVLQQSWEGIGAPAGNFLGVMSTESKQEGSITTIVSILGFTKGEAMLTLTLNDSGKLTNLTLTQVPAKEVLASPIQ